MHGGKREGAGRKPKNPKDRRSVEKQVKWTPAEWEDVQRSAIDSDLSPCELIRIRTLAPYR